ncbi:MAG: GTPase ObgE [Limosilactobacillus oris]|jgi:GTP-binding protein|uniref:GTPase ObgE n=1 Tax=Megasphaera sp. TaxID=2023260 RepID=UPI0025B92093|nr:GTPase ObgE [Megasphaera sp.]MCH3903290.1 GTPase ObgE [Limosilactobacillus oris]MCH3931647.1 GTPase ObgE [Megasphaera sp.]MCI1887923.1 GTPase ObgE [Sporolactobacillus sp.]MCI1905741.1 GTPase ObgE [Enterococcaceae bacterium]
MFIDRARIFVQSGKGGDGMSSFRHEKFVPKGGPNGGDGGQGGNVVLAADRNVNTLVDFRFRRLFKAKPGGKGEGSNKYGRNAEDLLITVPLGTIVKDEETGQVMADLSRDGQRAIVAKGGRGGRGNWHFRTSANRTPTFAERGEPGEERWLRLELKVLADVGLLGYPSVGKSSILRKVSAAQPEVAAYHFTTLNPILGVVNLPDHRSFVMADIPGLIDGASEGVGLGHDFLRHIERTKILIHVVDVSGIEGRDPIEDYEKINAELAKYSEKLARKRQVVAANKIDLLGDSDNLERLMDYMTAHGVEVYPICAMTGEGMDKLLERVWTMLEEYVEEPDETTEEVVYKAQNKPDFEVKRDDDGAFVITGARIENLVAMTNFDDDQSLRRFQRIWRYMELDKLLQEHGIQDGNTVRIYSMEFEYYK